MINVPQGGGFDTGQVATCPHCRSSSIRIRRRRHSSQLWRCRRCNRTFNTPRVRELRFDVVRRPPVFEDDIRRLERRARRRGNSRSRLKAVILIVVILAVIGGVLWWLDRGSGVIGNIVGQNGAAGAIAPAMPMPTPTTTRTSDAPLAVIPALRPTSTNAEAKQPTPTLAPVPTLTPTRVPAPELRHIEEKQYMLELINCRESGHGRSSEPVDGVYSLM